MGSIKKNFLYNVAYQVLTILLPFITAPYVSRVLGVHGVGTYSYTFSIASYFLMFATLGMSNHGNRSIAASQKSKVKLGEVFINNFCIQVVTGVVSTLAYILFCYWFVNENRAIALIQTIVVASGAFDINWFFFGLEKFKITVTRNAICKVISVLCIFTFVRTSSDLWKYVLILALTTLVSQLLLWNFASREISLTRPRWSLVKKNIQPVLVLFLPVLSYSLYRVLDKVMLGAMASMNQVGYFENAEKILNIPVGVTTALGTVMLPRVSSLVSNGKTNLGKEYLHNSILFVTLFSGSICFGISAISRLFIPIFYGSQFYLTGKILEYLIFTAVISGWANVIRMQYLIPLHRDRIYVVSMLVAAVMNCLLNVILIPRFGAMGTVFASLVAETVVFLYQAVAVRRDINWVGIVKENIPYLLIGAIMILAIKLINTYIPVVNAIKIFIDIVVGGVIFTILSITYSIKIGDRLSQTIRKILPI